MNVVSDFLPTLVGSKSDAPGRGKHLAARAKLKSFIRAERFFGPGNRLCR